MKSLKNKAKALVESIKEEHVKEPALRLNCWEFKKCGREPGGFRVHELGVCPTTIETALDGLNGGNNAGRACWAVAGTFCGGEPKGTYAKKLKDCTRCDFHQTIIKEEDKYESAVLYLRKHRRAEKERIHKEPGFLQYAYAKSKRSAEENLEVESTYISLLIAVANTCPAINMLAGSKRLCKDDLVDELMVIDAIADNPRIRASKIFFKTVITKGILRQVQMYLDPLTSKLKK
ncbi:MAG: hypothetical protein HQK91_07860 [Nitrospirae bacterium]|nr:hypothetical protein [Nitrospirota bacterium]